MSQVASAPETSQPAVRERVFSGIQPSGASHLGNYLGAQVNYVRLQDEYDAIYGIVDMHALTSVHDGAQLRQLTHDMVLDLLAVGLDPERCALIRQSDFPEHDELMWIFDTVVPVSWLERTPTYKEKREEGLDNSMGLLNYPVLQAADIVIYKASRVPVGKDQAAHLELSREVVRAFNRRYGPVFPEPEPVFTDAPTVLGIDGQTKMSKSAGNTIPIFAEPDEIRRLVMSMAPWNTIAMSFHRRCRISSGLRYSRSSPFRRISPEMNSALEGSRRRSERAIEVLPQPDSPTRPTDSPSWTVNDTSSTAETSPALIL